MRGALRYEWMRLRTLRSTWWLTGLSLLIAGLLGLSALGLKGTLTVVNYGDILTGGGGGAVFLDSILLSMIGVFAIGHEYRYGTIRPTLSALPRRSTVLAAKVLIVTGYVFVVALIIHLNFTAIGHLSAVVIGLLFYSMARGRAVPAIAGT